MKKEESFPTVSKENEDEGHTEETFHQQEKLITTIRDTDIETPDRLKSVGDLLNCGVDPLARDYNLVLQRKCGAIAPPFHMAVANALPQVTEMLLRQTGLPNVADRDGVTPAHMAADKGSAECLKILIEFGAGVNATTKPSSVGEWNQTEDLPISVALWLLPNISFSIEENSTPLHLAASGNHVDCVRVLLDHRANINAMNIKQQSPLYLAAKEGNPECLMMLLQNTDDCPAISTPTDTQNTALIECFRHGEKMRDCIKELVYRGADVSHHNLSCQSAVHEAVLCRWDLDMMKLLILRGHGMDFDRTEEGSPLQILMERGALHYQNGIEVNPPEYTDVDEETTLLSLRMGATRTERKKLLRIELNLPNRSGVLLKTLMDSFGYLPPLSELEAGPAFRPALVEPQIFNVDESRLNNSETPLHRSEEEMAAAEGAIRQEEESLEGATVAEKKRHYHQHSREVPSLLHLSRAAIRSHLQADVRKVISWPVPDCVKAYILLDHDP